MKQQPPTRPLAPDATMMLATAGTWAQRRGGAVVEPLDLLLAAAEVGVQTSADLVGEVLGRSASEYRDALLERLDGGGHRNGRSVYEAIPFGEVTQRLVEHTLSHGSGTVTGAELLRLAVSADEHPGGGGPTTVEPVRNSFRLVLSPAERRAAESPAVNAVWMWVFLSMILTYRLGRHGGTYGILSVTPVAWLVLAMPIAVMLALVLHESGHAIAGRLTGGRVVAVHLGAGRAAAEYRIRGWRLVLHSIPSEGRVIVVHPAWPGRAKMLGFYLAGVAANVLTVVVLLRWQPHMPRAVDSVPVPIQFPAGVAAREAGLIGSILVAGLNLVPRRPLQGRLASDGWNVLQLLRSPAVVSAPLDQPPVTLADGSMLLGDRSMQALRGSDGVISEATRVTAMALHEHRWADAAAAGRIALDSATGRAEQSVLSNIVADCLLLTERRSRLAEATALAAWSAEHAEPGPLRQMCECTLALALVLDGRIDDGERLLPDATGLSAEGYAAVRLMEAIIAQARGDGDGARSIFETVARRFPDSELLELAAAELGVEPPSSAGRMPKMVAIVEVTLIVSAVAALIATA